MVCFLPSGHTIVTITIFISASEAITGGCIFSILQLESSNFFSSAMELYSEDNNISNINFLYQVIFLRCIDVNSHVWSIEIVPSFHDLAHNNTYFPALGFE
jgi:hypothetical protein